MAYTTTEILTSIAVVGVCFVINAFTAAATVVLPGVLYVELLGAFPRESSGLVAMAMSIMPAVTWIVGPIASILINKFGCGIVSIGGGLVASLGFIMCAFSANIYHIFVAFGIILGCGSGIAFMPSITIIGMYFDKRRTVAFGFGVSGFGFGNFVFPPLLRLLIDHYGWRGAMLITGGIWLHLCLCGAVIRIIKFPTTKTPLELNPDAIKSKQKSWVSSLNLHVFKNLSFNMFCANNVLILFGLATIHVHLGAYARELGCSKHQATILYSAFGIANIIGRISFGVIAQAPQFSGVSVYAVSHFVAGAITALSAYITTFHVLLAYVLGFGFLTASLGALLPVVVVDILGVELLTSGYGYVLIFESIGTLVGPPCAGWIYDSTHNYKASLFVGGACVMVSSFLMTYQWFCAPPTGLNAHAHGQDVVLVAEEKETLKSSLDFESQDTTNNAGTNGLLPEKVPHPSPC